jgi:OOP family OmpA-OmpF porin
MKNIVRLVCLTVTGGCLIASGQADTGIYIGAGLGEATGRDFDFATVDTLFAGQNLDTQTIRVDNTHSAWKVFAGYQVLPYLAAEAQYAHLGRFTFDALTTLDPGAVSGDAQFDDWSISAVGVLPLHDRFDVFAKAGLGYWKAKLTASGVGAGSVAANETADGIRPVFGLGARLHITSSLSARAEWELYKSIGDANKTGKSDFGVWSVSVQYMF